jgi:hypothetical protein
VAIPEMAPEAPIAILTTYGFSILAKYQASESPPATAEPPTE